MASDSAKVPFRQGQGPAEDHSPSAVAFDRDLDQIPVPVTDHSDQGREEGLGRLRVEEDPLDLVPGLEGEDRVVEEVIVVAMDEIEGRHL